MRQLDRRSLLRLGLVGGAAAAAVPVVGGPDSTAAAAATPRRTQVMGRSVQGRTLTAVVVGPDTATRTALVVGCIHGNERAGIDVVKRLERLAPPAGTQLWLVESVNPDGAHADTRQNARGVDLNRNFPTGWKRNGVRGGTYYPGTGPLSEPESRAVSALVQRLRPDLSFWYHQHLDLIDLSGGDEAISRRYARRVSMRAEQLERFGGSVATWQNTVLAPATSVVVELPARVTAAMVERHARAVHSALSDLPPPNPHLG